MGARCRANVNERPAGPSGRGVVCAASIGRRVDGLARALDPAELLDEANQARRAGQAKQVEGLGGE